MGLACSQIRLLTLTARKADCEFNISMGSMKKMALTRESAQLSQEYYSRLQSKQISYYANGQYSKMNYSYLMGYGNNYAAIWNGNQPLKSDNSMILADYKGQVVLSDSYAKAITDVLGSSVMDASGRGGTFSTDKIPEILAALCPGIKAEEFKSVIDNNKMAIDLVTKAYKDMAQEAREKDDFRTESWAMTSGTLQACRVDILTQYSLLLTMVSLLEEAVNTLCRIHKDLGQLTTELKDVKGAGLERAAKYLKDVVGISGFKADQSWEYITTIRDCRNMVVHNGGRIKDDLKPKCDKFNMGYREEDSQLYIEYADVMKFYEAILDFMDRAFRLESSTSTQP